MATRLWFHMLYGFGDGQLFATNPPTADSLSGERELTKCFDNPSITTVAVTDNGYAPHTTASGGIECVDYPEESFAAGQP